jgi:hypothetical protein
VLASVDALLRWNSSARILTKTRSGNESSDGQQAQNRHHSGGPNLSTADRAAPRKCPTCGLSFDDQTRARSGPFHFLVVGALRAADRWRVNGSMGVRCFAPAVHRRRSRPARRSQRADASATRRRLLTGHSVGVASEPFEIDARSTRGTWLRPTNIDGPLPPAGPARLGTGCNASSSHCQEATARSPAAGEHASNGGDFRSGGKCVWNLQLTLWEAGTRADVIGEVRVGSLVHLRCGFEQKQLLLVGPRRHKASKAHDPCEFVSR